VIENHDVLLGPSIPMANVSSRVRAARREADTWH
jgi:hypothetical protein